MKTISKNGSISFLFTMIMMIIIMTSNVYASETIEDFETWGLGNGNLVFTSGEYVHDNWRFIAKNNGSSANDNVITALSEPAALSIQNFGDDGVDELHLLSNDGKEFDFKGLNFTGLMECSLL